MQPSIQFNPQIIFSNPCATATRTKSAFGTGFITLPLRFTPERALSLAILHDCLVCDKPSIDQFDALALVGVRRMIQGRIPFSNLADTIGSAKRYQITGDGKYSADNLITYCKFLSATGRNLTHWEEFLSLKHRSYQDFLSYHLVLRDSLYS